MTDGVTAVTDSFNFTKAAEEKNAENLLLITDAPELAKGYVEAVWDGKVIWFSGFLP